MTVAKTAHTLGIRVMTESLGPHSRSSTAVQLFAHDRRRAESVGPIPTAYQIERRDLRKRFTVYPDKQEYRELPILSLLSSEEKERFLKSGRHWRQRNAPQEMPPSGKFRIQVTYETMTGGAVFFQCAARRWKITRCEEREYLYGKDWTETVTEAWYLDSEQIMRKYRGFSEKLIPNTLCFVRMNNERLLIEQKGQRPSGLCACSESKTISRHPMKGNENREREESRSYRIVSLTEELFPESLFEVPPGFRQVPLYPNRYAMTCADFKRGWRRFLYSLGQGITPFSK